MTNFVPTSQEMVTDTPQERAYSNLDSALNAQIGSADYFASFGAIAFISGYLHNAKKCTPTEIMELLTEQLRSGRR